MTMEGLKHCAALTIRAASLRIDGVTARTRRHSSCLMAHPRATRKRVLAAFNSPFWSFGLVSTSVGTRSRFSSLSERSAKQIVVVGTRSKAELVHYDKNSGQFIPFLSGISALEPSFSRDGAWVTYVSYPDVQVWRSRADGSDKMQLSFPTTEAALPAISPDGTRVAFSSSGSEGWSIFLVGANGGEPKQIVKHGSAASWSPDGTRLVFTVHQNLQIVDVRTGLTTPVPTKAHMVGGWWAEDNTLVAFARDEHKFMTFNLSKHIWTDLFSGDSVYWALSIDRKYLYAMTHESTPVVKRIRLADGKAETLVSLKDIRLAVSPADGFTQLSVAPDGSPVLARDTSSQEIYALNMRWP